MDGPLFGMSGRLPPSNVEAEQALLGAVLVNNKAIDRCEGLDPTHFADPVNGRIFQQCRKLIASGRIVDPITLKGVFEHAGVLDDVGGIAYLVRLVSAMVGIINAGDYAKVVRDCWVRRELIDAGERLVNAAFGEVAGTDPAAIGMEAIARIDEATTGSGVLKNSVTTLDNAMDAALAAMEGARERKAPAGISTGFRCIDARLGGLEPGLVYVIAGRPGMGKSALAAGIAINAARTGVVCAGTVARDVGDPAWQTRPVRGLWRLSVQHEDRIHHKRACVPPRAGQEGNRRPAADHQTMPAGRHRP